MSFLTAETGNWTHDRFGYEVEVLATSLSKKKYIIEKSNVTKPRSKYYSTARFPKFPNTTLPKTLSIYHSHISTYTITKYDYQYHA